MIEITNLTKQYGNFRAVNGISFRVRRGEIFAFLGVNGAGKTTTLRMITGVLRPTSGKISIGGFDMATEPEKAKAITGFVPDRPYLYNRLSAREFLFFVGELYSIEPEQISIRADELLTAYGLIDWQNELIEGFSHGMKQRLAICAALIHSPAALIVDEPMVGLDPHGAKLLKDYLRQYARQNMAIMLSTHSLNVAEEVADRIAIIHQGKIIQIGTLSEIREKLGVQETGLEEIFLQLTWETDSQVPGFKN